MPTLKQLPCQFPTPATAEQPVAQAVAFHAKEAVVADGFVKNFYPEIGHCPLT